ncbi:MAG: hypothetical protein NVSMB32_15000 [Actinomycetota bacterium]
MGETDVVRAAGGVVMRCPQDGPAEVALVHRPAYNDWSFPKGKLQAGEGHKAAALREVQEETGLVCRLGPAVGSLSYKDRRGRDKVVRYWVMEPLRGEFAPNSEVDELRWLLLPEARETLSYPHDRLILDHAQQVHIGSDAG